MIESVVSKEKKERDIGRERMGEGASEEERYCE